MDYKKVINNIKSGLSKGSSGGVNLWAVAAVSLLVLVGGAVLWFSDGGTSDSVDCGEDMDCFVSAAENCNPATVDHTVSTNIFGVLPESENTYTLEESDSGDCVLGLVTNDVSIEYSDDLLSRMKDSGISQDQIDQQIQQARDKQKEWVGLRGSCVGTPQTLSSILDRWSEGSFSTSDWEDLDCSGSYFEKIGDGADISPTPNSNTENRSSNSAESVSCALNNDCSSGQTCVDGECENVSDVASCNNLTGSFEAEECIKEIAVQNQDESICGEMEVGPSTADSVELDCYAEIAISQNDSFVCDPYASSKADTAPFRFNCYKRFAIETDRINSCDRISDSDERQDCRRRVEAARSYPDLDRRDLVGMPWLSIAKQTDNQTYCEYIDFSFTKEDCEEYFE